MSYEVEKSYRITRSRSLNEKYSDELWGREVLQNYEVEES